MIFNQRPIRIASAILIAVGVILLGLNLFVDHQLNVALPLVFILLGGVFFILVHSTGKEWRLAAVLYIPSAFFLSLGIVFLLNVLTGDWSSWAYAWLFILSAVGLGALQAHDELNWPMWVNITSWAASILGICLFVVFGAIVGGLFIQIMAPILIIAGGLALRWLKPEAIFPQAMLERFHLAAQSQEPKPAVLPVTNAPKQEGLVEPLSARELEVLCLVSEGYSNQEIATRLSIAASTVKTHINNLYGKLGVETRGQAIKRARDLGLVS